MFSESYYQITLTFSEIMLHSKHFRIKLLLILQANFRSILPNNLSDLSLFFSTGIVTSSVFFSEFFGHKLGLASQKMNMVNTFAMVQSSKAVQGFITKKPTFSNLFQNRDYIHNLFFHVLYSRQPVFIYSIRSKAVDLIFQLWWAIVGGY